MRDMLRAMLRWWFVVLVGCGPITYVRTVTRSASDSIEAARAANADKLAPYWWTRATQYLRMAHVEAARADFQGANRFGRLAGEAADKATEEALVVAKDPSKGPLQTSPKRIAPAKPDDDDAPVPKRIAPAKDTP
jgi:hypothetical protein